MVALPTKSLLHMRDMMIGIEVWRETVFLVLVKSSLEWVIAAIEKCHVQEPRKCWRQLRYERALTSPAAEDGVSRMPTMVSISGFVINDYDLLHKYLHMKGTGGVVQWLPLSPYLWGYWEGSSMYHSSGGPVQRTPSREALGRSSYWQPWGIGVGWVSQWLFHSQFY